MVLSLIFLLAYLLGSIPVGLLVARAKGVDITKVGSGNIGATNAVRAVGPVLGLVVFILDVIKGLIPSVLVKLVVHQNVGNIDIQALSLIAGIVAVLGHMFSPWLKFKGGKGIATGLGAALGSIPVTAVIALAIMVLCTIVTKYISLSSLIAASSTIPISIYVVKESPQTLPIIMSMVCVIILKHRANIARLASGTEPKFSIKKQKETTIEPSSS